MGQDKYMNIVDAEELTKCISIYIWIPKCGPKKYFIYLYAQEITELISEYVPTKEMGQI